MKIIKNKMSGTKGSHIQYRGFWIRNNKQNRSKVDRFYNNSLVITGTSIMDNQVPVEGLSFMGDNLTIMPSLYSKTTNTSFTDYNQLLAYFKDNLNAEITATIYNEISNISGTAQERVNATRKLFRFLAFTHEIWNESPDFEQFRISTANKALSLAQKGMSEAFLVFSLLHPKLCNTQIQPYVVYESLIYNDEHWETVIGDPVYNDNTILHVYFLSGFNRLWKEELDVARTDPEEWNSSLPEKYKNIYMNYRANTIPVTIVESKQQSTGSGAEYDYSYLNLTETSKDNEWNDLEKSINDQVQNGFSELFGNRIDGSLWTRNALIKNLRGRVEPHVLDSSSDEELLNIHHELESWEMA